MEVGFARPRQAQGIRNPHSFVQRVETSSGGFGAPFQSLHCGVQERGGGF